MAQEERDVVVVFFFEWSQTKSQVLSSHQVFCACYAVLFPDVFAHTVSQLPRRPFLHYSNSTPVTPLLEAFLNLTV